MSLTPAATDQAFVPLSINGIACRLPGADNIREFWSLLARGGSGVKEAPPERMDRARYYSPDKNAIAKSYSYMGAFIPERAGDPSAVLNQKDWSAIDWDPCHKILLDVAKEAMAEAGWDATQLPSQRAGVYVGHSAGSPLGGELVLGELIEQVLGGFVDLPELAGLGRPQLQAMLTQIAGRVKSIRPKRQLNGEPQFDAHGAARCVAEAFGLTGPQVVTDAACASSLVALELASIALAVGEIDWAIVAGASYWKADSLLLFSQAQSCSASQSRPFDAEADGLINSEGYVVMILRRQPDALAAGDRIMGVIQGVGIGSDGRGRSLWAPRAEGQAETVKRAYRSTLPASTVQYIEAHATSTQVGDATELEALTGFYKTIPRATKLPLGSVKSNLGHTLETAGLAGLTKALLAMREGQVPPTINLQTPNPAVPWDEIPLAPVRQLMPWPDVPGMPRRAAVNAFGIGGLNGHVVVDGIPDGSSRPPVVPHKVGADQPVAIIGRGAILPGAFNTPAFRQLMQQGTSQLKVAPAFRWPQPLPGGDPTPREEAVGGYIEGYEYDWRTYKIPPNEVAEGNPLQFMLLDAAQQALDEAGYGKGEFDRLRTATVVGSIFGGEFSHALQIGLRLPEILDELSQGLKQQGRSAEEIKAACASAQKQILKRYPALRDRTGSFTASTLSSRISKTLNLLGGALAMDSSECSGLAALQVGCQLLSTGAAGMVVCAAAQRSLDRAGFATWRASNRRAAEKAKRLGLSAPEVVPPGEGVVVLLLKPLEQALRDGNRVLGVIDRVTSGAVTVPAGLEVKHIDASCSPTSRQLGHLTGACGLLEVLRATLETEQSGSHDRILIHSAMSSQQYTTIVSAEKLARTAPFVRSAAVTKASPASVVPATVPAGVKRSAGGLVQRVAASNAQDLATQLRSVAEGHAHGISTAAGPWSVTMVASPSEMAKKAKSAIDSLSRPEVRANLADQGIFLETPETRAALRGARTALLFPGQGSQYPGMLAGLLDECPAAQAVWDDADHLLHQLRPGTYSGWLQQSDKQGERDVHIAQTSLLTADLCAYEALCDWGFEADCFVGHSFGEYAALTAAGALPLQSALSLTLDRADAVCQALPQGGAILSIAATPQVVLAHLSKVRTPLYLSHQNAPLQTLVGGTEPAIDEFAAVLKKEGIAALRVPVACPFHTPLLRGAQTALHGALARQRWLPPHTPVLSTVDNRYVSDRADVIQNLNEQLVAPLDFVSSIERLYEDGVRVFVECGPGQVLTKLARQILGQRPHWALAIDHRETPIAEIRERLAIAAELTGGVMRPLKTATVTFAEPAKGSRVAVATASTNGHETVATAVAAAVPVNRLPAEPMASAPVAAASHNDADIAEFMIDFIIERTGYPRDVVDMQADLEADLGIDSILKAQMLGEVRDQYRLVIPTEGPRPSISAIRTLTDALAEVKKLLAHSPATLPAAPASAPVPAPAPAAVTVAAPVPVVAAAPAVVTPVAIAAMSPSATSSDADLAEFMIEFIIERTGYPRDVVDLQADLEADLGIDSILKAQMLGEVRDHYRLVIPTEGPRPSISAIRTLTDALAEVRKLLANATVEAAPPAVAPVAATPVVPSVATAAAPPAPPVAVVPVAPATTMNSDDDIAEFMIEFIIERTGYPRDVVDLQADLEADLGIDSILKAQMLGEVRDHYRLVIPTEGPRPSISAIRTLTDALAEVKKLLSASPAATAEPSPAVPTVSAVAPTSFANGHYENGHHENGASNGSHAAHSPPPRVTEPDDTDDVGRGARSRDRSSRRRGVQRLAADDGEGSSHATNPELKSAYDGGYSHGAAHREQLQQAIRDWLAKPAGGVTPPPVLSPRETAEVHGLAAGAEVHPRTMTAFRQSNRMKTIEPPHSFQVAPQLEPVEPPQQVLADLTQMDFGLEPGAKSITRRFRLEMSDDALTPADGRDPLFSGRGIVVGSCSEAATLVERLEKAGVPTTWVKTLPSPDQSPKLLEEIWAKGPAPHLFVLTPRDAAAVTTLDEAQWLQRREQGLMSLFWFCQAWVKHIESAELYDDASLIGITNLGGDFGISGNIVSAESAAVGGMLKAIIIECWVNGWRTIPIKVLDMPPHETGPDLAHAVWHELLNPSYDVEIGWSQRRRSILRAISAPAPAPQRQQIVPEGNWIITGGARGITAHVVSELAKRFPKVTFHLLGTAPAPQVEPAWVGLDAAGQTALRTQIMLQARQSQQSPLKAWQNVEKAIEIAGNLRALRAAGATVQYYSCDVSRRAEVQAVVDRIHREHGAVHGVLHGAGIGKDSRFDRKDPETVHKCFGAKMDGALNLMAATFHDPLQAFVAFGSISGRFGANGHTDYSAANDMLSKLTGCLRQWRPEVPATTFHWHAWGDVGMATKPETKLSLEMIGMDFMPAKEGTAHLLRELAAGLPNGEVLITDTQYFRMFFPADRVVTTSDDEAAELSINPWPLVRGGATPATTSTATYQAEVHPVDDPFLAQHRLNDKPLLPMVMMTELMAEGAAAFKGGSRPVLMKNVTAKLPVKFHGDQPLTMNVVTMALPDGGVKTELRADFWSRQGKLIDPQRQHSEATVYWNDPAPLPPRVDVDRILRERKWEPTAYNAEGAMFWVGPVLRCLRKISLDVPNRTLWGRIAAPSLGDLAGAGRTVTNWLTPSAILDASLYANGILAWACIHPGVCLPQVLGRLRLFRLPKPGDSCLYRSTLLEARPETCHFEFFVYDSHGHPLFCVEEYTAGWVAGSESAS